MRGGIAENLGDECLGHGDAPLEIEITVGLRKDAQAVAQAHIVEADSRLR